MTVSNVNDRDQLFAYMCKARGVNDHFNVFPSGDQHLWFVQAYEISNQDMKTTHTTPCSRYAMTNDPSGVKHTDLGSGGL